MPARIKRSVDDIFDDLDKIGKRKPSVLELYPEEFSQGQEDNQDGASPAPKIHRTEQSSSSPTASSLTPKARMTSSRQSSLADTTIGQSAKRSVSNASIIFGGGSSPTLAEFEGSSESPAFTSELDTKHRKAEEAADLALFLARGVGRSSSSSKALLDLVHHLQQNDVVVSLRNLRMVGQCKSFITSLLGGEDGCCDRNRSALHTKNFLLILQLILEYVPHDVVPVDVVFARCIQLIDKTASFADTTGTVATTSSNVNHHVQRGSLAAVASAAARKRVRADKDSSSQQDESPAQLDLAVKQLLDVATLSSPLTETPQPEAPDSQSSSEVIALRIMTKLLLDHNQSTNGNNNVFAVRSLSNMMSKSAAVLFMEANGLNALCTFFQCHTKTPSAAKTTTQYREEDALIAVRLLALVTCDQEIVPLVLNNNNNNNDYRSVLSSLFQCVAALLSSDRADNTNTTVVAVEALRALINITSAIPQLIPNERCDWVASLCEFLRVRIGAIDGWNVEDVMAPEEDEEGYEETTLCICLAVNLLCGGKNVVVAKILARLGDDEDEECMGSLFLAQTARAFVRLYDGADVHANAIAGYLAMLIACISLCVSDERDFRVAVVTALARAFASIKPSFSSQDMSQETSSTTIISSPLTSSEKERQLKKQPMKFVVAVLQEFVMFQSSVGLLTKEVLVSMHRVIERVISQNHIVVEDSSINGGEDKVQ